MKKLALYRQPWFMSIICTLFISYPNIAWIRCELCDMPPTEYGNFILTFAFRFIYFWVLLYALLRFGHSKLHTDKLSQRLLPTFAITLLAFALYEGIVHLCGMCYDRFISTVVFQFIVIYMLSFFISYTTYLHTSRQEKEQEISQLRIESLENRYNALANQINPHFFFNSLNSISSLVRKKDERKTLDYIAQLSYVFRYILQAGKKGLVPLSEELEMVDAFSSVMEVRYAYKLRFEVKVAERDRKCMIPVLSLLPLLENVGVHNIIDSDHTMTISISTNDKHELCVSNPIYAKLEKPDTNGTGLKNLQNRFRLLKNADIRVEETSDTFSVYLPLTCSLSPDNMTSTKC